LRFYFLVVIISVITVSSAYGSGGYPCCIGFHLDKTEYTSGDTVLISVMADQDYAHSNEMVKIKISDVTFGPDYASTVYQAQKALQDGKAEFEYKTPQSSDRYRYLVTMESPLGTDSKMFFTKKDASNIAISDVKLLTPKVKQGDHLNLEAKIVDGVGNPLHYLRVIANSQVPHQSCSDQLAGVSIDASPLYSIQPNYWSGGIINMTIPIANTAKPGTYDLEIDANGDTNGFSHSQATVRYEILASPPKDPPSYVFAPVNFHYKPGFMTEQETDFVGQTTYNGCGAPIPHIPIRTELTKYNVQSGHTEILVAKNLTSDDQGYYHVHFDPVGIQAGYFSVRFMWDNPRSAGMFFGFEMPHNVKDFTIKAAGKEFVVHTDTWYSIPQNVSFSEQEKKLTFDVDTSDTYRRISLQVPTSLLDGDFVFFENGVQRTDIQTKKTEGFSEFDFKANTDKTRIELVGTSAVPEFGLMSVSVLIVSLVSVVIFGTRFRKNL